MNLLPFTNVCFHILYCKKCKNYTLEKICPSCKINTVSKNPPRFSPQDHYGKYRRKLKKIQKVD